MQGTYLDQACTHACAGHSTGFFLRRSSCILVHPVYWYIQSILPSSRANKHEQTRNMAPPEIQGLNVDLRPNGCDLAGISICNTIRPERNTIKHPHTHHWHCCCLVSCSCISTQEGPKAPNSSTARLHASRAPEFAGSAKPRQLSSYMDRQWGCDARWQQHGQRRYPPSNGVISAGTSPSVA